MKIIWLSEIKWSYLKTRKQQILSKFPDTDKIYFIEPISSYLKNNYTFEIDGNVSFISVPQFQVPKNNFLSFLTNNLVFYYLMKLLTQIYTFFFIKINPDIVIVSNVYWSWLVCKYRSKNKKIIYDCNDNPLAFPKTKKFKRRLFISTLKNSHRIITPSNSYKKFIPKEFHKKIISISNGVDFNLFKTNTKKITSKKVNNSKPIVMYIGAIDEWFDINLIEKSSKKLPDYQFIVIGPASKSIKRKLINSNKNISYFPAIKHEDIPSYLNIATVCIIPFIKNDLTNCILPNKIFEYSAAGKKTILTNFNSDLKEFKTYIDIANNEDEFIEKIKKHCSDPTNSKELIEFSKKYDWLEISKRYRKVLTDFLF